VYDDFEPSSTENLKLKAEVDDDNHLYADIDYVSVKEQVPGKYAYDCENRLTDVNDGDNERVAKYEYDYQGRRIMKTTYDTNHEPQGTSRYVYDGDQIIAEYNSSGTLLRKYVYGPGIDEPMCMIDSGGGKSYYHFDRLGSVVALSNTNSLIIERYSYDVFGRPTIRNIQGNIIATSAVGNPYMFTGREYDAESGLYYYRARYYKPDIGRFLQTDPIGYRGGLNLYTYCKNNPVNWTDPWGLAREQDHDNFSINPEPGKYGGYDKKNDPLNPFNTMNHFGNLSDVEKDMDNDIETGKRGCFNDHMHQGQDAITNGSGPLAVVGHMVGSVLGLVVPQLDPDNPYKNGKNGEFKPSYVKARDWTHSQENRWNDRGDSDD